MSGSPDLRRPRTLSGVVGRNVLAPRKKAETGWQEVGKDYRDGASAVIYSAPAFENSWTHGDPDEDSFSKVQFYLSDDGEVRIKGVADGGDSGTVVFTLPEGYRPPKIERFEITATDYTRAVCEVWPDGSVYIYYSEGDIGSTGGAMSRAFSVAMT
jgi:hypothetical protein